MPPQPRSRRLPADTSLALCIDRADLFLEGARKLIGSLPWFLSGPLRAGLLAAPPLLSLGGDPLDPWFWRTNGFDLAGGVGLWSFGEKLAVVASVHRQAGAEELLRRVLRACGAQRFEVEGPLTLVRAENDEICAAFGFALGHLWFTFTSSREDAFSVRQRVLDAWDSTEESEGRALIAEVTKAPHALRLWSAEKFALFLAPAEREVTLGWRAPSSAESAKTFGFLCAPGARGVRLPPGALAVLSGFDIGEIVRESRSEEGLVDEVPAAGVGVLVLHAIDAGIESFLRPGVSLQEVLFSGLIHLSFGLVVDDAARWRGWVAEAPGSAKGRGQDDSDAFFFPQPRARSEEEGCWLAFEQRCLLGAVNYPDLVQARRAARHGGGSLQSSIEDPEVRALFEQGEPFFYLQVAALTRQLAFLVRALWKEGQFGKSIGVAEALHLLGQIRDFSFHLRVDGPEGIRGWAKIRLS